MIQDDHQQEELLAAGLEKLGLNVEPNLDTSASGEYAVYYYDRSGILWGDDAPCLENRRWTVAYVAPLAQDRRDIRSGIIQTIFRIFGVWPEESDESDRNGQVYLYTFNTIGGIDDGEV